MTNNYHNQLNKQQYFVCEYCVLLDLAKKRVKLLCDKGHKAYYKHSEDNYVVYARC